MLGRAPSIPGRNPYGKFILVCDDETDVACEQTWSDGSTLEVMQMHFDLAHEGRGIRLKTVWTGKGPGPATSGDNRAARRAQARRKGK